MQFAFIYDHQDEIAAFDLDPEHLKTLYEEHFNHILVTMILCTFRLPMAHTCFNQLCLQLHKTRQKLKTKLIIAISNSEGFGIE